VITPSVAVRRALFLLVLLGGCPPDCDGEDDTDEVCETLPAEIPFDHTIEADHIAAKLGDVSRQGVVGGRGRLLLVGAPGACTSSTHVGHRPKHHHLAAVREPPEQRLGPTDHQPHHRDLPRVDAPQVAHPAHRGPVLLLVGPPFAPLYEVMRLVAQAQSSALGIRTPVPIALLDLPETPLRWELHLLDEPPRRLDQPGRHPQRRPHAPRLGVGDGDEQGTAGR